MPAPRPEVHDLGSRGAEAMLAAHGLTRADLERAVARFEAADHLRLRTWIGINAAGFLGATRPCWQPHQSGAIDDFVVLIPWDRLRALLQLIRLEAGPAATESTTAPI